MKILSDFVYFILREGENEHPSLNIGVLAGEGLEYYDIRQIIAKDKCRKFRVPKHLVFKLSEDIPISQEMDPVMYVQEEDDGPSVLLPDNTWRIVPK